eukprot:2875375-Prymnesium_polylepis.1
MSPAAIGPSGAPAPAAPALVSAATPAAVNTYFGAGSEGGDVGRDGAHCAATPTLLHVVGQISLIGVALVANPGRASSSRAATKAKLDKKLTGIKHAGAVGSIVNARRDRGKRPHDIRAATTRRRRRLRAGSELSIPRPDSARQRRARRLLNRRLVCSGDHVTRSNQTKWCASPRNAGIGERRHAGCCVDVHLGARVLQSSTSKVFVADGRRA